LGPNDFGQTTRTVIKIKAVITAPELKKIAVQVTFYQSNTSTHHNTNTKCYARTLVKKNHEFGQQKFQTLPLTEKMLVILFEICSYYMENF